MRRDREYECFILSPCFSLGYKIRFDQIFWQILNIYLFWNVEILRFGATPESLASHLCILKIIQYFRSLIQIPDYNIKAEKVHQFIISPILNFSLKVPRAAVGHWPYFQTLHFSWRGWWTVWMERGHGCGCKVSQCLLQVEWNGHRGWSCQSFTTMECSYLQVSIEWIY